MKVLVLEFTFFCGSQWEDVTLKITALNKEQLKEAFLREVKFMKYKSLTPEKFWEMHQEDIKETELTFPIVEKLF